MVALFYGTPPLTMTYFRKVGKKKPDNITLTNIDEQYAYDGLRPVHSSRAFVVELDLNGFESATSYEYFITKVIHLNSDCVGLLV